ncbi:MAG: hypothetical protein K0V04_07240 [Deltaproteobacteria bacterium]|nr:hypothetical protein [Deltaproteobacteria bacterium]
MAVAPEPEPAPTSAPVDAQPDDRGITLDRGYLRVMGVDRSALVDALSPRVPHLDFEQFEAAADVREEGLAAFVELRPEPQGVDAQRSGFVLTIVVSDGRAFDRQIETDPDEEETTRVLASTVANLLIAIEAGTIEADRGDVPLPIVAAPVCPTCECPAPVTCPVVEPTPPKKAPPAPIPPAIQLGPVVIPTMTVGLGAPIEADRFAGAGATVGLHARLRRGAFFGVEVRTIGRGEALGTQLVRFRGAVGAGYRLRRGAWSLGASLWGTVEPWRIRGAPIDPPPAPMWGLAARIQPALVHNARGGRPLALTIGPTFELGMSGMLDGQGAQVGLVSSTFDGREFTRMRVGGLEFSTGLSATLWFGLPRPSR